MCENCYEMKTVITKVFFGRQRLILRWKLMMMQKKLLEIITKSEEQQKVLDGQPFLTSINTKFKSYIPQSKEIKV